MFRVLKEGTDRSTLLNLKKVSEKLKKEVKMGGEEPITYNMYQDCLKKSKISRVLQFTLDGQ